MEEGGIGMGIIDFLIDPVCFLGNQIELLLTGWGVQADVTQVILYVLGAGVLAVSGLCLTIALILAERKLIGRIQDRLGPNRVGPFGLFQTFADMVKIFTKEYITPIGADVVPFNMAPIIVVGHVLMLLAVVPVSSTVVGTDINIGVLYLMAVGAIGALGIILAGWSSNNKYALLGAFRAVGVLIAYEVPMALVLLIPVMFSGSMSVSEIVEAQDAWFILLSPIAAGLYFITSIAEVGRSPFDLLEAESELVSGFNIEYSGLKFGFFYVGDFLHAYVAAMLFTVLFLGGWRGPGAEQIPVLGTVYLMVKSTLVWFLGLLIRGSLPRFRIDQMMNLTWKLFVPLSLVLIGLTAVIDKIVSPDILWLRVIIMLVTNVVILIGADRVLSQRNLQKNKERRVVAPDPPRPVARPENTSA